MYKSSSIITTTQLLLAAASFYSLPAEEELLYYINKYIAWCRKMKVSASALSVLSCTFVVSTAAATPHYLRGVDNNNYAITRDDDGAAYVQLPCSYGEVVDYEKCSNEEGCNESNQASKQCYKIPSASSYDQYVCSPKGQCTTTTATTTVATTTPPDGNTTTRVDNGDDNGDDNDVCVPLNVTTTTATTMTTPDLHTKTEVDNEICCQHTSAYCKGDDVCWDHYFNGEHIYYCDRKYETKSPTPAPGPSEQASDNRNSPHGLANHTKHPTPAPVPMCATDNEECVPNSNESKSCCGTLSCESVADNVDENRRGAFDGIEYACLSVKEESESGGDEGDYYLADK